MTAIDHERCAKLSTLRYDSRQLNWLLHRPGVTVPIIGVRTMDQLLRTLNSSAIYREELQTAESPLATLVEKGQG